MNAVIQATGFVLVSNWQAGIDIWAFEAAPLQLPGTSCETDLSHDRKWCQFRLLNAILCLFLNVFFEKCGSMSEQNKIQLFNNEMLLCHKSRAVDF